MAELYSVNPAVTWLQNLIIGLRSKNQDHLFDDAMANAVRQAAAQHGGLSSDFVESQIQVAKAAHNAQVTKTQTAQQAAQEQAAQQAKAAKPNSLMNLLFAIPGLGGFIGSITGRSQAGARPGTSTITPGYSSTTPSGASPTGASPNGSATPVGFNTTTGQGWGGANSGPNGTTVRTGGPTTLQVGQQALPPGSYIATTPDGSAYIANLPPGATNPSGLSALPQGYTLGSTASGMRVLDDGRGNQFLFNPGDNVDFNHLPSVSTSTMRTQDGALVTTRIYNDGWGNLTEVKGAVPTNGSRWYSGHPVAGSVDYTIDQSVLPTTTQGINPAFIPRVQTPTVTINGRTYTVQDFNTQFTFQGQTQYGNPIYKDAQGKTFIATQGSYGEVTRLTPTSEFTPDQLRGMPLNHQEVNYSAGGAMIDVPNGKHHIETFNPETGEFEIEFVDGPAPGDGAGVTAGVDWYKDDKGNFHELVSPTPNDPNAPKPTFTQRHGDGLRAAGQAGAAASAGFFAWSAGEDLAKQVTAGGVAKAGISVAVGAYMFHQFLTNPVVVSAMNNFIYQHLGRAIAMKLMPFLTNPWFAVAVMAAIVVISVLKHLGREKERAPSPSDTTIDDLTKDVQPVWYERLPNPQVLMLSGLLSMGMGNSLTSSSIFQSIPVAPTQMTRLLDQVSTKSGRQMTNARDLVGKVMVVPGNGTTPDVAYIVDPGMGGNYTLTMVRLDTDGHIIGTDPTFYPPFFEPTYDSQNRLVGIQRNQQALTALQNQNSLLSLGTNSNASPGQRRGAVNGGAAADHPDPDPGPS